MECSNCPSPSPVLQSCLPLPRLYPLFVLPSNNDAHTPTCIDGAAATAEVSVGACLCVDGSGHTSLPMYIRASIPSSLVHTFISCAYLHLLCIPSSLVHTFISCAYLHLLCIPSSLVHTFISCAYLHPLCIPSSLVHTFISCAYLHLLCIPSSLVHTLISCAYLHLLCM